jgi:hypothetical protein
VALTFDQVAAVTNGARFVRADLHIHSVASLEDVAATSGMTVGAIVDAALAAGVEIISITDHNSIDAIPSALEYSANFSDRLLFIPGVELTTTQGHLLVYFDPADTAKLEQFFHRLDIVRDNQGSRVQSSMIEVIRRAADLGGLCVAAHIDTAIGFEVGHPGFPAWKKDLISESGLRGLEFRDAKNASWYTADDAANDPESIERRKYARARAENPAVPNAALGRFHNSDAHTIAQLIPPVAMTRIKVSALNFESFRAALADPEARIRIDELLPRAIPRIIGLGIDGGFLDGTVIRFADNLNILFGGRGTGKSTAVRALAFAFGRESLSAVDAPFQNVSVFCEDASGVSYRFDRAAGGDVFARIRKEGSVAAVLSNTFPVEYYAQGELGRVAQRSLTDASALQAFLDRHISFEGLLEQEAAAAEDARDIALQLAPLREVQNTRKAFAEQLQSLEERLRASEGSKIKQVAEFQNKLTAERTLRTNYSELLSHYRRGISLRNLTREPKQLRELSRIESFRKSTAETFAAIESQVDEINDFLIAKTRDINARLLQAAVEIEKQIAEIDQHHVDAEAQVQLYVEELKDKGLATSIAELNDLSKRKAVLVSQIARVDSQKAAHDEMSVRFDEGLARLGMLRREVAQRRAKQREELNVGFNRDNYGRFEVLLIPDGGLSAPEFETFLAGRLEGTYYQAESIAKLRDSIAPGELADLLEARDLAALMAIDAIGAKWAAVFLERLGGVAAYLHLRTLPWTKAPRFKVIDRATRVTIPFAHLSDGQKHTVMLTIALLAGAHYPLIIDQPEDDLDSQFIAERVVRTLRAVKELRQIVLVTHNANIAVLGDSEELLAMVHDDAGGGRIASRGSIDDPETKIAVQNCLEGGVAALRHRLAVYGL